MSFTLYPPAEVLLTAGLYIMCTALACFICSSGSCWSRLGRILGFGFIASAMVCFVSVIPARSCLLPDWRFYTLLILSMICNLAAVTISSFFGSRRDMKLAGRGILANLVEAGLIAGAVFLIGGIFNNESLWNFINTQLQRLP